jgi:hypothetical protein
MFKQLSFFLLLFLAPMSWGGSVTTALAGSCTGDTVAWLTVVDTVTNSGRQNAKVSVLLENQVPIGGIALTFTLSRPDMLSFSTNHIAVTIDTLTHDTTVARICDLDTVGTAVKNFDWIYPSGELGDTALPQCGYVRVAGQAKNGQPIPPGSWVLFRLVMDLSCLSDTASARVAYINPTGNLSDPTGNYVYWCNMDTCQTGHSTFSTIVAPFGSLTIDTSKCGDVNADGKVLLSDVIILANKVLGKPNAPGPCPTEAGDVNGDTKSTLADVLFMAKYVLGLCGDKNNWKCSGTCFPHP